MSGGIFITGAGTLAQELVRQLQANSNHQRIVVFSRSELRQYDMRREFPEGGRDGLRYMLGDVRDYDRLCTAMEGCEYVIHTAALKRIEVCQYNPQEAVSTNVIGSINVIRAAQKVGVKRVMVVSTDKAVEACTHYGATKACMEGYAIYSNNLSHITRTSVVRYANVYGSNGSVVEIWRNQVANGEPLTITDKDMTRMWITKQEAAKFIVRSLFTGMRGGEVFIPVCEKKLVLDVLRDAVVVPADYPIVYTGLRADEKLHEVLVSPVEARRCYQQEDGSYIVYPFSHEWDGDMPHIGTQVPEGWCYASNK